MNLVELLKKHGIEDNIVISEVEGYVNSKLAENSDSIPKSRFDEVIKQRNELRADLSEREAKIENLNKKIETFDNSDLKAQLETFKTENETLKQNVYETKKAQWEKVSGFFNDDNTKDKAEKIKKFFQFPEGEQDLTLDQIDNNLKEYERFEAAGVFNVEQAQQSFDSTRAKSERPNTFYDPFKIK